MSRTAPILRGSLRVRPASIAGFFLVAATAVRGAQGQSDGGSGKRRGATLAAVVGYGFEQHEKAFGETLGGTARLEYPNAYALALGLRGGFTFRFGLYVGGELDWFAGRNGKKVFPPDAAYRSFDGFTIPHGGATITFDRESFVFGPELGYDFRAGPLVVRPAIQDGLMLWRERRCLASECQTDTAARDFVAPGLSVGAISRPLFAALSFRYLVPLTIENSQPGPVVTANVGLAFR